MAAFFLLSNEVDYFLIRMLCQPTEVLRTDHPVAYSTHEAGLLNKDI